MYPTERKRYIILGAAIGAVFLFFVVVMMLTQLRDGEDYARQAAQGISITQQTSCGPRGDRGCHRKGLYRQYHHLQYHH